MALTRPIQYEPKSSDERAEHFAFKARVRQSRLRPAAPLVSNATGNALAGTRIGGGGRIRGGNPGPVGDPIAYSTDGSPVTAVFD